jgi:predicted aminopeptidase
MSFAGVIGTVLLLASTVCLTSGCSSLGYYAGAVQGHLELVGSAKPVSQWLDDGETPQDLKDRLALSQRMRDFAISELQLPDNASYRRFADLKRSAAVWNVVAAPELSLKLKTWCFPLVGCVGYRGYFQEDEASRYAEQLRTEGLEVGVYGVPAYSTLGKLPGAMFSDPLLNTFIRYPEGELARMIFHELAHQVAYADNDTVFNESFATAVEQLGSEMWLERHGSPEARAQHSRINARRDDFRALTMDYRNKLDALYRSSATDEEKRAGKQALMAALRAEHDALKQGRWGGFSGYDGWFLRANNASLGVLSAYNELVPEFERLFEREGRDFNRFYSEVRRIAAMPMAERRAQLKGN